MTAMIIGGARGSPLTLYPSYRLNDLDRTFLEVGLFRDRAGGVQGQLVDQAVLVKEWHEYQPHRRLVAATGFHQGGDFAAPTDDLDLVAALQAALLGIFRVHEHPGIRHGLVQAPARVVSSSRCASVPARGRCTATGRIRCPASRRQAGRAARRSPPCRRDGRRI